MSSNIRILIKIYYISSIFNFIRQIISRINPIKSRFILIIHLYFKACCWMGWNQKYFLSQDFLDPYLTLAVPSTAITTPLPANIFPKRLAPNVPNSILRNPPF